MERHERRKILGERIKILRKLNGYTQQDIGNLIGCTKGMVSSVEKGNSTFRAEKLLELAELLHIPGSILLSSQHYSERDLDAYLKLEAMLRNNPNSKHRPAIEALIEKAETE